MEYTSHTIEYPDGSTVVAHHPVMTKEEHDAAMKGLKEATARFMRKVTEHEEKECG